MGKVKPIRTLRKRVNTDASSNIRNNAKPGFQITAFRTSDFDPLINKAQFENQYKQVTEKKEKDKTNANTTQTLSKRESLTKPLTAEGKRKADFIKKALMVSNFQEKITG